MDAASASSNPLLRQVCYCGFSEASCPQSQSSQEIRQTIAYALISLSSGRVPSCQWLRMAFCQSKAHRAQHPACTSQQHSCIAVKISFMEASTNNSRKSFSLSTHPSIAQSQSNKCAHFRQKLCYLVSSPYKSPHSDADTPTQISTHKQSV